LKTALLNPFEETLIYLFLKDDRHTFVLKFRAMLKLEGVRFCKGR
jgi:hypothetical protein